MEVVDKPDRGKAGQDVDEISLMLTNRNGGFAILSNEVKSRFEGVFFRVGKDIFKVIENLRVSRPVTKVTNQLWNAVRERGGISEEFFMPLSQNAIAYELSEKAEFELLLDCKHAYDDREWGRIYEISVDSKCIVIKFSKKNEPKENSGKEYELYLAVCSDDLDYQPLSAWEKRFYSLDRERNSPPFDRYVFNACKIKCTKAVFAVSATRAGAVSEAKYVFRNLKQLKEEKEQHIAGIIHRRRIPDEEVSVAYQCAVNALDSLLVDDEGLAAGFPWFFQFWARDELVCAKALIEIGEYGLVKKMLFRHLDMISPDGSMPNKFPDPDINSADAVGWLFMRFEDFISILEKKGVLKKYLSRKDLIYISDRLHDAVSSIIKSRTENGLVVNGPKETWMDTSFKEDSRDGARVEIQALMLSMLRLFRRLSREDIFEIELRETVRSELFDGKMLADGKNDFVARPNVFIAAYACPELLSPKEWKSVFDSILPKLWLEWGGLSSIDKSHQLYTSAHTGQDSRSYHRGDSWFWVNNLAAIVLARLDRKKYAKYISRILHASVREMLYMGITGYSAELSSASELKSQGCPAQAWSSAMFIELVGELYG